MKVTLAVKYMHELKPGERFTTAYNEPLTRLVLWNVTPEKTWTRIHRNIGFLIEGRIDTLSPIAFTTVWFATDE